MGRVTTKADLVQTAEQKYEKMWSLIEAMPMEEQTAIFNFGPEAGKEAHWGRDKNMRDVLVHLYEWHQLLLNWVESNQKGDFKPFLPEPYNWRTYGQMNIGFWNQHQSTSYEDSKDMLRKSHKKVMKLIAQFSNEELFDSKHFTWTGTSTIGAYCVSATASHYDWAMKKIRMHDKTYKIS